MTTNRRRNITILIAAGDPIVRNHTRRIIQDQGYSFLLAPDPQHAIRLSKAYPGSIQVLIVSLHLPPAGGADLARKIRAQRPGIRVLALSDGRGETLPADADGMVLEKPFAARDLLDHVAHLLEESCCKRCANGSK